MVHKTSIIPGLSAFLDAHVLSQYAPTSLKRIAAAGAIAIYLNHNNNIVDIVLNNPLFVGMGISSSDGMINIEKLRDIYKDEINKVGFARINFPLLGPVDFTADDLDALYQCIMSINTTTSPNAAIIPASGGGIM
jgi:hypothetical protein